MLVARSPLITPTRISPERALIARSTTEVLPAPGEAIMFKEKTPAASRRARFSAARRSLALRMSSTTGMRSGMLEPLVSGRLESGLDVDRLELQLVTGA